MAATFAPAATGSSWFSSSSTPTMPVRIPTSSSSQRQRSKRTKQKSADSKILSKSLGTYPHSNFFRSQSTTATKISYAGCLYKRSNHPITSPTSVTHHQQHQQHQQRQQQVLSPSIPLFPNDYQIDGNATAINTPLQHARVSSVSASASNSTSTRSTRSRNTNTSGLGSVERKGPLGMPLAASSPFGEKDRDDTPKETQSTTTTQTTTWQENAAWKFMCTLLELPTTLQIRSVNENDNDEKTPNNNNNNTDNVVNNNNNNKPRRSVTTPTLPNLTLSTRQYLSSSPIPVPLKPSSQTTSTMASSTFLQQQQQILLATAVPRRTHSQSDATVGDEWQQQQQQQEDQDILAADGHVWRARYCVLEQGVLYFYRNRTDAESFLAVAERDEQDQAEYDVATTTTTTSSEPFGDDGNFYHTAAAATTTSLSSSLLRPSPPSILAQSPRVPRVRTHIWEKRVPVSCVGAVRSAETEYGPHALELSAVAVDDNDVLILRARNATEMSEWLFQFHRSIEVWVKDIMTTSSTMMTYGVGEMIVPAATLNGAAVGGWISPRVTGGRTITSGSVGTTGSCSGGPFLSHGHGRSSLHRRRVEDDDEEEEEVTLAKEQQQQQQQWNQLLLMPTSAAAQHAYSHQQLPLRPSTPPLPAATSGVLHEDVFELQDFSPEPSPELSPEQTAPIPPEVQHPAPPKGKYVPPHLRKPSPTANVPTPRKYVPPHLRSQHKAATTMGGDSNMTSSGAKKPSSSSLAERLAQDESSMTARSSSGSAVASSPPPASTAATTTTTAPGLSPKVSKKRAPLGPLVLGGCADPDHIQGSILDDRYIPRKASKLYRTTVRPFGLHKGHWEIGAVSECGARESNEDSYLIVGDLQKAFDAAAAALSAATVEHESVAMKRSLSSLDDMDLEKIPGLFCVFDGHCGNHAARYAAERFTHYLYQESLQASSRHGTTENVATSINTSSHVEQLIRKALAKLDHDFCNFCVHGGRAWESGATALIAALCDDDLIIANLGDARGVLSRTVEGDRLDDWEQKGWTILLEDDIMVDESDDGVESGSNEEAFPAPAVRRPSIWKSVTHTHSPSREDERQRIENANGWITTEKEIPVSQAHRLDLHDELARDILNRTLARDDGGAAAPHRLIQISRVCGELAVSRALGDRDFKALSDPKTRSNNNAVSNSDPWEGSVFFPYPENHSRAFQGDLVSSVPEVECLRVGQAGVTDEFLLLACDGLWDVMDADDAIRVARRLMLDEGYSVKHAAARLAKLAVHLGSSDNVTVLIVRFVDERVQALM